MKVKQTIVTTSMVVGSLAMVGGFVVSGEFYNGAYAEAGVSYQDEVEVEFELEPSMKITFPTGDLDIGEVTPGQSKTSSVTVNVATNSASGYELKATVGNETTYTTSALVNAEANNATIASIATPGALPTSGSTSCWGYKSGTSDSVAQYSALPLYSDTGVTLNKTTNMSGTAATGYSGTNATVFEIGAYVGDSQVAGDYKNVVNFTATANIDTTNQEP
ncbi:hypothetical protein IKG68_02165 [Candidatus Saccharibacteria bacterium]|nr:hypothetical protein [Candidatus Saccharibacteria bacterium]